MLAEPVQLTSTCRKSPLTSYTEQKLTCGRQLSPKQCEDHTVLGRPTMGTIGGKATSCAAFLAGAANSTTHPSAADVCSYMAGVTIAEYRAITKGLYAPACCLPETDPLIEYCRGTCGKHGAGPCWATDTTPWC